MIKAAAAVTRQGRVALVAAGLILSLGLGACDEPPPPDHKETLYIFGTLVEIQIKGADKDKAQAAVKQLEGDFQRMHDEWHAWKGDGELMRLNAAIAAGQPFEVSDFVLPLLKQAKAFYAASDGLFNAGLGKVIGAWGFHADEIPKGSMPDLTAIRAIAETHPGLDDITIDGHRVTSSNPDVQFDFGGFGKGVALDYAEKKLAEMGIQNAVINAGGDLNTMGDALGRPWKVGIRHPRNWGVIASVELSHGEEMYTSGNYERFREADGIRYAHIIDPRTGMPVTHIVSASVIHDNGASADAAATALAVAGPDDWYRIAKQMGIHYALLVGEDGTIYANPEMLRRVAFEDQTAPKLVTSPPLD